MTSYMFMSFSTVGIKRPGQNIGCCIIECDIPDQAYKKCGEFGLIPKQIHHVRGYSLDEETFQKQGMELNRFYTREEMEQLGFEKECSTI